MYANKTYICQHLPELMIPSVILQIKVVDVNVTGADGVNSKVFLFFFQIIYPRFLTMIHKRKKERKCTDIESHLSVYLCVIYPEMVVDQYDHDHVYSNSLRANITPPLKSTPYHIT